MQALDVSLGLSLNELHLLENTPVRIAGYQHESIVDGPGLRTTVFFQGCDFHCVGCHNEMTHDKTKGKLVTALAVFREIYRSTLASGVTFSGGEPFLQEEALLVLAKICKAKGRHITIYTGHEVGELLTICSEEKAKLRRKILKYTDIVITGRFVQKLKTLEKPFVGSSNQEIYDLSVHNPWEEELNA